MEQLPSERDEDKKANSLDDSCANFKKTSRNQNTYDLYSLKSNLLGMIFDYVDYSQVLNFKTKFNNKKMTNVFNQCIKRRIKGSQFYKSCSTETQESSILCLIVIRNYPSFGENKYLASAGRDNKITIWSLIDLNKEFSLSFHEKPIEALTQITNFDSNNRGILASGSKDMTIQIQDIGKRTLLYTLYTMSDGVKSIVYPDDFRSKDDERFDYLVFGCGNMDRTIRVMRFSSNDKLYSNKFLAGHKAGITHIVYAKNYSKDVVISASKDKSIRMWSLSSLQCMKVVCELESNPLIIEYIGKIVSKRSNYRNYIAVGTSKPYNVYLIDFELGSVVKWYSYHKDYIWGLCTLNINKVYKNEGNVCLNEEECLIESINFVSGSANGSLFIWNTLEDESIFIVNTVKEQGVNFIDSNPKVADFSFFTCTGDKVVNKYSLI